MTMAMGVVSASPGALLLELDPDLAVGVPAEELEAARLLCRGQALDVPRGRWPIAQSGIARNEVAGLVIVEGVLCREVALRDRSMLELLGPGDVLQPPVVEAPPRLGDEIVLTAVSDLVVVVLGPVFIRAAARWPSLLAEVQRRLEAQREAFAIQALIAHLPKADHRLLLTLHHLAGRWGYVTPEGIVLPFPLTHDVLGQLIGIRRPTATLALKSLESERSVRRLDDGSWLVTALGEREVAAIAQSAGGSHPVGERLILSRRTTATVAEAKALRAEARQIRRHRYRVSPRPGS